MKAHLRHVRISMKKANLIAAMVRGMAVDDAMDMLGRIPKKGAFLLRKLIASAAANAQHNDRQKRGDLLIKTLIVNKGPGLRRFIPIARGRARRIEKATSHLSVELGVRVPGKNENSAIRRRRQGSKGS